MTLLNIRKGPGKNFANIPTYPVLAKNTVIGLCDVVKGEQGDAWYYIKIPGDKGVEYGFAKSDFISVK